MTARLLRGRTLNFKTRPQARDDHASYVYEDDGALLVENGLITAAGSYAEVKSRASADIEVIDHRPYLLMAGFIDPHIHFPQMQVTASYAANLLEWLNTYTFVEEQRFADAAHSARFATLFFDELLRHGTTTVVIANCSLAWPVSRRFLCQTAIGSPSASPMTSIRYVPRLGKDTSHS